MPFAKKKKPQSARRVPSRPRKRPRGRPTSLAPRTPPARRARINPRKRPAEDLLPTLPGVAFRQRIDWTFEDAGPRIESFTGLSVEAWRRPPSRFWEVIHEQDAPELQQRIRRNAADGSTVTNFRVRNLQTGRISYVTEIRRPIRNRPGKLLGYEGFWLDITRQSIAEMRLASAAWKETLAVLTMGLAHDFNNILAGICSLSDTFLSQLDTSHPFYEGLGLITQNARQASQLVHRILNLHRGKTGLRNYHDLNEIASDVVDLLRKVVPRRIEVTAELSASAPLYVDSVEFRQVIINLALNAVDAMPDRGQLRLQTSVHQELPELPHYRGIRPRLPCCCLSMVDTGCGIKSRHLETIFDPFFTTKTMSKGSGLGLYNAKLFVEKHHGAISVESTEGQGATFRIWLPQSDFTEAENAEIVASQRRRTLLLTGPPGQSLDGMAEFLRLHNFQVFTASQRPEDWLQSEDYAFDGVIVQVQALEFASQALLSYVRRAQLPVKCILQILACHQDQLDTQLLMQSDLILTPDLSETAIVEKLHALFKPEGRPG